MVNGLAWDSNCMNRGMEKMQDESRQKYNILKDNGCKLWSTTQINLKSFNSKCPQVVRSVFRSQLPLCFLLSTAKMYLYFGTFKNKIKLIKIMK